MKDVTTEQGATGRERIRRSEVLKRFTARAWTICYGVQARLAAARQRHAARAGVILLLSAIGLSFGVLQRFRAPLDRYFGPDSRFAVLQNLLAAVGSALTGAAAVAFALIVFALQVNIERMPHGLFRRLSSDRRLLASFFGAFALAIATASAALLFDRRWLTLMTLGAAWATCLIPVLLVYAYTRALRLVSPTQHLAFVLGDAQRSLRRWERRANRVAPLFEAAEADEESSARPKHDHARTLFFQVNGHWTRGALEDLRYAIAFARRYAERRDHAIARNALAAVVAINATYIHVKGRTFYPLVPMFDHPLTTDGFINETLEELRQEVAVAIARQDEAGVEIVMQCMSELGRLYARIDYGAEGASKYHSVLAAGYLATAIETTISRELTDVAMQGVRLLGTTLQDLLPRGASADAVQIISKIGDAAQSGLVKESTRPLVRSCVEELSRIALAVLVSRTSDARHTAGALTQTVYRLARLTLVLRSAPLTDAHGQLLDPYFSMSSATALPKRLTDLGNELVDAKPDDKAARDVIQNILVWAEGLEVAHRDLLVAAAKARAIFSLSLLQSSTRIARVLLALARAPAARDESRSELEHAALGLVAAWSWVPTDEETVGFVESFRVVEYLFEVAIEAHMRGCPETARSIRDLVLQWGFMAGKHDVGLGGFESSLVAAVTITLAAKEDVGPLLADIDTRLRKPGSPGQEIRRRAAREVRERAVSIRSRPYSISTIDQVQQDLDPAAVHSAFEGLAQRLTVAAP